LLVKTVNAIASGTYTVHPQSSLKDAGPQKPAPKINKEDCRIHWNNPVERIHNFIRGLSPYPTAWSELSGESRIIPVKISRTEPLTEPHSIPCGTLVSDGKTFLKVSAADGFMNIIEIQQAGKSMLNVREFLRGFPEIGKYKFPED
jgi:methionyl-tRNA formyltransferase